MKRGVYGQGHIRQRSDGRWEALYYDSTGQRRSITGKKNETAKDVAAKLRTALTDLDKGIDQPKDNRQTLGEYLDAWLATKKPSLEVSTYTRYEAVIRLYIKPALGRVPLTKVTVQQVEQLYAHVSSLGKAANTVQKVRIPLRAALADAVRFDMVGRNVAAIAKMPVDTTPQAEMQTYTAEQVNRLFAVAQGDRLEALYILLPSTGCRLGELLGLRWEHLDLDRAELRIVGALKDVAGHQWLGDTKTPRSRRTIPLTALAVESLRRHKTAQLVERMKHGAGWNPDNLVFCTTNGTPFSQTNTRKYYLRLLQSAGLPLIRRHDQRHTNGRLQLTSGAPLHEVSAHLGHTTPVTTLAIYAHVLPGAADRTRERLERTLAEKLTDQAH